MTTLDDFHTAVDKIRSIEKTLNRIGSAFFETGNADIGEKLYIISAELEKARTNISNYVSESIRRECETAQRTTTSLLELALNKEKI